ncbi:MAG TPA: outer membrane beta-barrel protein, partial [Candidatus Limnocylindria bacterium]|nr:outer membrane beta-barrel protein [Candidatus Limnocylindria bacterium]
PRRPNHPGRRPLNTHGRGLVILCMTMLWLAAPVAVSHAQDSDLLRFYGALRVGYAFLSDGKPVSNVEAQRMQQVTGLSLGVNFNRYFGVELAADAFESDLKLGGVGKIGEYGTFSLIPQVRVRYPLFDGRLTPYVLAGVGIGHNEFNDRKKEGIGRSIHATDTTVVAAVGGGVEYFLTSNIAFGVEARYLVSRDQEIEIDGRSEKANLDALLTSVSLRLLFPELPGAAPGPPPDYRTTGRFYAGVRLGGGTVLNERIARGVESEPVRSAVGVFNTAYGGFVGADLTRFVGVEFAVDGYDFGIHVPGVGAVGEYAIYTYIPQLRLRYPVLGGRVTPYVVTGVGVSFGEFKDRKPRGEEIDIGGEDFALAAVAGVGIEYFVASNIAVGLETKYLYSRGHTLQTPSGDRDANLDSMLTSVGLRIYFGKRAAQD